MLRRQDAAQFTPKSIVAGLLLGFFKGALTFMLVDGAGLETREKIEREAEETHGTEGQVVGNLTRLLVCHLQCQSCFM